MAFATAAFSTAPYGADAHVGGPVPLDGAAAGASTVSGGLGGALSLSGTSAGASTVTTTGFGYALAFTGTANGVGAITGTLGLAVPLQGSINGTSVANALLAYWQALASTSAGLAATAADLHITRGFNGAARGRATVRANIAGSRALSGSSVGAAHTTATLGVQYVISGSSAGVATVTADITRLALMTGEIDGVSQVITGYLGLAERLVGSAHGVATDSAALTGILILLTGPSNGRATVNARLSGVVALSSSSHGVATDTAALTVYELLVSTAHGTSSVTANLGVRRALSGVIHGVATDTATLQGTRVALTGRSDGRATVVGALGGVIRLLVVRSNGVATVHADLTGLKPANDNFANATLLSGTGATLAVSTLGATLQTGEPDAAGRTDTVWYHFVASGEGTLTIDTSATAPAWPSVIDVFTGTALTNLVLVGTENVTYTGVAEPGDVWIRISSTAPVANGTLAWSFDLYPVLPPSPYFTVDPVDLQITPTVVQVTLANLAPDETVSFTVDNSILLVDTVTVDDTGAAGPTALRLPLLADGAHTLTAVTSVGRVDVALTVTRGGVTVPTPLATPPSLVPQTGVVRWVFQDKQAGANPAQYVVPINPNKMTTPFGERAVSSEGTTAIDGQTLMWEGIKQPVEWQFSGVILDQAHYDNLELWSTKPNRIYIIDHYSRAWECYPKKFDPSPEFAIGKPWKHSYTMTVVITRGPVTPQ